MANKQLDLNFANKDQHNLQISESNNYAININSFLRRVSMF